MLQLGIQGIRRRGRLFNFEFVVQVVIFCEQFLVFVFKYRGDFFVFVVNFGVFFLILRFFSREFRFYFSWFLLLLRFGIFSFSLFYFYFWITLFILFICSFSFVFLFLVWVGYVFFNSTFIFSCYFVNKWFFVQCGFFKGRGVRYRGCVCFVWFEFRCVDGSIVRIKDFRLFRCLGFGMGRVSMDVGQLFFFFIFGIGRQGILSKGINGGFRSFQGCILFCGYFFVGVR